jgi:hypothetical protein
MTATKCNPDCALPCTGDVRNGQRWQCPKCGWTYWCHKRLWHRSRPVPEYLGYMGWWYNYPPWWKGGYATQTPLATFGLAIVVLGILVGASAFHYGGGVVPLGISLIALGVGLIGFSAGSFASRMDSQTFK